MIRAQIPGGAVSIAIEKFPALVLNADFRPLSYFPLSLWPWQDTIKAVFLERVNVVISVCCRACAGLCEAERSCARLCLAVRG